MTEIYLGLGSNLGNREEHLSMARARLMAQHGVRLAECSPIIETAPWGPVPQGAYLNQVCRGETNLSLHELLHALQNIERLGGRNRAHEQRWGPRTIDLDLLAYGDEIYGDEWVQVPHPRLHERLFVLVPLATIAPDWRHPRLHLTVTELLESLL